MDGYPTSMVIRKVSRGFRVTGRFRGPTGRRYARPMFTSSSRQQLREDLELYLVEAAVDGRLVDVEGM